MSLAAAATALMVAGCGASTAGSGDDATIQIGTLIPLTGTGLNFSDYLAGAKAAVQSVNSAGGINGHKINLVECDDQNNPNQATKCARDMINAHVVAVAGGVSLFGAQIAQILNSANIPWIGALPITAAETSLPNAYPIESGNLGNYGTIGTFAKRAGHTSVAGFVLQGPLGDAAAQALQQGVAAAGLTYKGTVTVPIDATDYAPYVQKLRSLGADAVGTELAAAQFLLLATASAQAGAPWQMYQPAVGIAPNIFDALSKTPEELARITPMSAVPPADKAYQSSYPGIGQYIAAMEAYEQESHDPNGQPANYTSGSISSWQAVEAVNQIAKSVPAQTPLTPASFLAALRNSGPIDTGLGPAWNPPPPAGPAAYPQVTNGTEFAWELKNGGYGLADPNPIDVLQLLK
ncbi:MAG TPA: ABC transporter substrate-binding protein [Amycolatopsis sp.]|nr:ABC transporter substrate-binding protein [Amycolatopsis sp.]